MNRNSFSATVFAFLLVGAAPGWGAQWNPTASDPNGQTAGGSSALGQNKSFYNTAFGFHALQLTGLQGQYNTATGGKYNTATGSWTLKANTTGTDNTATGANALEKNTTGEARRPTGQAQAAADPFVGWRKAPSP